MHPDPLVEHLLQLGLIDAESTEIVEGIARQARDTPGLNLAEHELFGIAQALGRGVERIALASADAAVSRMEDVPADDVDRAIEAWLKAIVTPTTAAFAALFAHRLSETMHRRLDTPAARVPGVMSLSVSFVDLRGSTGFMLGRSDGEIMALADQLYAVGQAVAARHEIVAGKFLGDGVLLVSRDQERLLRATTEAVAELGARTPLRAGAGIATGRVVRRAGDWHGPPVNLAARLAELAKADEIYVDGDAARRIGEDCAWTEVTPRGLTEPRRVAVVPCLSAD